MKRLPLTPRKDWEKIVSKQGLVFYQTDKNLPYWNEGAHYRFTAKQIDELESATNTLFELCLGAAQHIIDKNRFAELGIPEAAVPLIKAAWEAEPPSIYGRFDLAYDGKNPPTMLEFNADTPTSLLEASVVQWYWQRDVFPKSDQFNSIHERLVAKWTELKNYLTGQPLYFAHVDDESGEDTMTISYLRDTAEQAGLATVGIPMKDIGWDSKLEAFVDLDNNPMMSIFKLYPWEWLLNEEFGVNVYKTFDRMQWMEPIWKMLWSNKGILPILWELNPGHPNLLESYFKKPSGLKEYAKKPFLSREGANVTIKTANGSSKRGGDYGEEGYIYQALANIPVFDGKRPVIGSWVIDCESAGMGIREADGLITDNRSQFVPHIFD
jgi:glutathionylspermidine synthase